MRTKALILSAMIGAAGIVSSSAADNVYSVNVVGYITLKLTNTFSLIANQLNNGQGNLVTNLFPFASIPVDTVIYKYNGVNYTTLTRRATVWFPTSAQQMTLAPGEGVFVKKPAAAASIDLTFVGEVMQGDMTNDVALGFDIYSGQVPQAGGIKTVHNFPAAQDDYVYKYDGVTGTYRARRYVASSNTWAPGTGDQEPKVEVGEAVYIKSTGVKLWTRYFKVNP